jgi:hypothetical protein
MTSTLTRIIDRVRGLPRTLREFDSSLKLLGFLRQQGWQRSTNQRRSLAQAGSAIPWYTYPAIEWLQLWLRPTDRVFEYGCGQSTLWYAGRVASVRAVDHDADWLSRVQAEAPDNVSLVHALEEAHYASRGTASGAGYYDVVAIDGRFRVACAAPAIAAVKHTGIVILDNSDRPAYAAIHARLASAGFARIDFSGMPAGAGFFTTTSVYFRDLARMSGLEPPRTWGA